jgi:NADH-quinone oxidoreductase subunit H
VAVTLFLGGPSGPHIGFLPSLWPVVWFLVKLVAFIFVYIWLRATLPRLRYDQLMDLGWKRLIPVALYWLLLIAALRIGRDEGWSSTYVLLGAAVALVIGWTALSSAMRVGRSVALQETQEAGGVRA